MCVCASACQSSVNIMQNNQSSEEEEITELERALLFATNKHRGQWRRGGEEYVNHCIRVSNTVSCHTTDRDVVIAALLHDTLEDTDTSHEELVVKFGTEVADLVRSLSNDEEEMKKMGGKRDYLAKKINSLSANALLIKLADRIDNISDLSNNDWSRRYCEQTRHVFLESLLSENLQTCHVELLNEIRSRVEKCEKIA